MQSHCRGSRNAPEEGDLPILFHHIPKTAGATFREILGNIYREEERMAIYDEGFADVWAYQNLSEEQRNTIRLYYGHQLNPVFGGLPPGYRHITFVREPLAHVVSQYRYVRRNPDYAFYSEVRQRSFLDYLILDSGYEMQARLLAFNKNLWDEPRSLRRRQMIFGRMSANVHRFSVIGVTERFDESLVLMKRLLGWKELPVYRPTNVAPAGEDEVYLSPKALVPTQRHLTISRILYRWANERLDSQIASEGPSFQQELDDYRGRLAGAGDLRSKGDRRKD